ncbi:helix-turn-helix transcriptional regulator [Streptomyces sp. NPDC089915]|uniref:helix-turn-helix domain-containing protein n=1 Tax=Streptomyces sp. NPDC089915 TaxID=3155186 RepID=UPI00341EED05
MRETYPGAAELVQALRRLRSESGDPTLEKVSHAVGGRVSAATLSRFFSGSALPSEQVARDVVGALLRMTPRSADSRDMATREFAELYAKARRARAVARTPRPAPDTFAERLPVDAARLHEELRELLGSRGISLAHLARYLGMPTSTLSDVLRHRLPSAHVVRAIADACQVPPAPLLEVLAAAERALDAARAPAPGPRAPAPGSAPAPGPRAPAPAPRAPAPRAPAPGSLPAARAPAPQEAASPVDVLVRAAVTRPPAEIAALVAGLQAGGQAAFAARIVEEAVRTRGVADVTALALALLATDPARPAGPP